MTHTNTEAVSDERLAEIVAYVDLMGPNSQPCVPGDVARSMAAELLSRRSASNTGGVEVKAEPKYDSADHHETDGTAGVQPFSATKAALASPPSPAAEAEPVAQGSCASCNGTGDTGGNPSYGMCPDCDGTGKFPPAHPSSSVSAEVTVTDESVKRATIEFLMHKGEEPMRVTRGGREFWELSADAMRAALASINGGRENG